MPEDVGVGERRPSFLISPAIALVPTLIMFVVAWTLPANVYSYLIPEHDYIDFNPISLIYVVFCITFFLAGFHYSKRFRTLKRMNLFRRVRLDSFVYLLLPMGLAIGAYCIFFIGLASKVDVFNLILSPSGGQTIKELTLSSHVLFQGANQFAMAILWWGWSETFKIYSRKTFYLMLFGSIVFVFLAVMQADRGLLISFLLGLFVTTVAKREGIKTGIVSFRGVLKYSAFVLIFVVIFIGFAYLRGNTTSYSIASSFMGYGPASFNRMAAVLSGNLHFKYADTGYFLLQIEHIPFTDDSLLRAINYPDGLTEYYSEFRSITDAGLQTDYQWATIFGYTFASAGIAAFIYFLCLGFVAGRCYRYFIDGFMIGAILYPLMFNSIAIWFAFNSFFYWSMDVLSACILLFLYMMFFTPRAADGRIMTHRLPSNESRVVSQALTGSS